MSEENFNVAVGVAMKAKEHRGTNEYGLDVGYMTGKLNLFLRDIDRYTRDEAARVLARLAITADESVLGEPEFTSIMPAQQSPAVAAPDSPAVEHAWARFQDAISSDGAEVSREQFHSWADAKGFCMDEVWPLVGEPFENSDTQLAWEIWQASRSVLGTPSPLITEQDAREKVLLEAVFKIEKKYFRTIHDHGAAENAQIVLAGLRAMVGLPMILKRDLPKWDGVAYVMPPASNLVANQPGLLAKLNNNPATQE